MAFSFSILFQIFKYLGNFHSLIILRGEPSLLVCLSYQIQSAIINFNHSLDVPCWRVSDVDEASVFDELAWWTLGIRMPFQQRIHSFWMPLGYQEKWCVEPHPLSLPCQGHLSCLKTFLVVITWGRGGGKCYWQHVVCCWTSCNTQSTFPQQSWAWWPIPNTSTLRRLEAQGLLWLQG